MASLEEVRFSARYHIRFRYSGRAFKRALKTTDRGEAESVLGRVEETIRLLERGRLEMPTDADTGRIEHKGVLLFAGRSPQSRRLVDCIPFE